jgi:Rho GDP-dissociation inhibitor
VYVKLYAVLMTSVENEIVSGLKYLQVVKRSGMKGMSEYRCPLTIVDKMEAMLGSYGPNPAGEVYTKIASLGYI